MTFMRGGGLTQAVLVSSSLMLTASTYNSFRSIFWQSHCLSVCLEPVLGQLAARYHYLLDSGQSNLSACSCFIELDKYNM